MTAVPPPTPAKPTAPIKPTAPATPQPPTPPATTPPPPLPRRRLRVAAVLGVVLAAGAATTTVVRDPAGDMGGDLLYAVAVYVFGVLVFPRARPLAAGATALAWCWAVEAIQATGLSADVAEAAPPAAWVLGTGFAWRDLALYAVGVAVAVAVDRSWARRRSPRAARPTPPARTSD